MTFEKWLTTALLDAEDEARKSHIISMNSYGAGFDRGFVAALTLVLRKMSPAISECDVED